MNSRKRNGGALLGAGILAMVTVIGGGVAHADPPAGTFRNLAGVGSDTTTPVIQGLAEDNLAITIAGVKQLASYNAIGGGNILPKNVPGAFENGTGTGCEMPRPNGSSSGRATLINALTGNTVNDGSGEPGLKCLQFARASDANLNAAAVQLVYIPFAGENMTWAPNNTSSLGKNMATIGSTPGLQRLKNFYNCTQGAGITGQSANKPYNATSNPIGYRPMIPQLGSGTGPYWIKQMYDQETVPPGVSTADGGCVQVGADENGNLIQEHNGTQVDGREMTPYSVAQWTSQTAGIIAADVRGNTRLGQVAAINPFGEGFPINRPLFNAIKKTVANGTEDANYGPEQRAVFVDTLAGAGNNALMCQSAASGIMSRFGLTISPDCGQNLAAFTTA